jgi:predicted metal-dependent HD superfamily phosphohydrolase
MRIVANGCYNSSGGAALLAELGSLMPQGDWFSDLLDAATLSTADRADLVSRVCHPARRYHGRDHLATLWRRHLDLCRGGEFDHPRDHRMIASAIAYHDAVHEPGRLDNELRSAALWRAHAGGLAPEEAVWVAETIEATADHLRSPDALAGDKLGRMRLWVLDLDLTPLGEQPDEFALNTALLRAEFSDLDDRAWEQGRLKFLRRFLQAPRIYRSPAIAAVFEAQARRNIASEFARAGTSMN